MYIFLCQNSPRDMRVQGLDPVLVLRMSERNWLNVLTELNTEDNQAAFGETEHFQRLIKTCKTNIDTLSTIRISADVVPRCLPQDHNGNIYFGCLMFVHDFGLQTCWQPGRNYWES